MLGRFWQLSQNLLFKGRQGDAGGLTILQEYGPTTFRVLSIF